jgi:hypothetical protein
MMMRASGPVQVALLSFLAFSLFSPDPPAQAAADTAKAAAPEDRDGQHDFDFALGTWTMHLKKLEHPLSGSLKWVEFDGTLVARKVWDGRANMEEVELNSPGGHIEGLTVRFYNPRTRQWAIYWANAKNASVDPLPQIGQFRDGRGEFYGQDTLDGKLVYVRFIWTNTQSSSPHFEQSFSQDGGKTWEVNWVTDQTRVNEKAH